MQDFAYLSPGTIPEAIAALGREGARALAGGTDLIPQMRERRREPSVVVDLKRIAELRSIAVGQKANLEIGAATSCSAIARHALVRASYPALAEAVGLVGSLQVQSRASLGGNVCNASPSADTTPILIALDARARIVSADGAREEAIADVIAGPGRTTLRAGELLTAILLPPPAQRGAAAYLRFTPRREMDIAIAGVAAHLAVDGAGRIVAARLALAAVGPTPIVAKAAAATIVGQTMSPATFAAAGTAAAAEARPISDTRGSADYRRMLVEVLTARALAACAAQLGFEVEVP